jgi:phosphopantothenoylcysteine synthetase/decarboxylase
VPELLAGRPAPVAGWTVLPYHTFEDLDALMAREVADGEYDAVVHSAAVSDYRVAGTFAPADGTHFDAERGLWAGSPPALADRSAGKVKSDEPELWLRLVRTPKLVDRIRTDWGFAGVLVKFKLEVGVTEDRLLEVAERSRQASRADWMVANTLDGAAEWAYLGPFAGGRYERLPRADLDDRLLDCIELSVKRI